MIKFNEVTWYSKLAAIVFFIGVLPSLTFYIGTQYEEAKNANDYRNILTSVPPKNTSGIYSAEGCVKKNNKRICTLKMSDNQLYTFHYDGEMKVEVYKDNSLQQTITLPTAEFNPGTITNFMMAMDVNFDGFSDLGIKTCEGATGNVCYGYYLFNPQMKKFEYSKEFTATGGFPEASSKEIRAHWNNGCAGGCFSERTYKVINNKPVLVSEINQEFDDKKQVFIKVTKELKNGSFITSTSTVTY